MVNKSWKIKNPIKMREQRRRWRLKHPEKVALYAKTWRKKVGYKIPSNNIIGGNLTRSSAKIFKRVMIKKYPKCQICNSDKKLEMHHFKYENSIRTTGIVCRRCHSIFHRSK